MRVHGYLMGDGRFFLTNPAGASQQVFLVRRLRPLVEGTLARRLAYRFMPDFGQGNPVIQEVYLETTQFPAAHLRAGKFKAPIGLEVMRQDRALTFPERSLASDMVPLRELGVQVAGSVLEKNLTYEAGFFNGTSDGANADFAWSGSNETAGRIRLSPFTPAASSRQQEIAFGIGASVGHEHGALPSYKTVGQKTFFKFQSGAYAQGLHVRLAPQAEYFKGPLGVMAEFVVSDLVAHMGTGNAELRNSAWEVSGSYFLTGERNSYGIATPVRTFNPAHPLRDTGAWEIAFRHSEAQMDTKAFPVYANPSSSARVARESAGGVSWYLNRGIKLMAFFENTTFSAATANRNPLTPERLIATRLQLAF